MVYGQGSKHANRVKHVLAHEKFDPVKAKHSVFCVCKNGDSLKVIDEAWAKKQRAGSFCHGNTCYEIDMGRTIGTAEESKIMIVTKPGSNQVITAYPF